MLLAIKPPSQTFLGLRHAFLPDNRLPNQAGTCVHLCSWVRNVWRSPKGVCVWGYSICCTKRTWNNQLSMDWFSTKQSCFLKNFLSSVSLTSHGCFFFAFTSVIRRLPAHTGRGVLLEQQIASNRGGVRRSDSTVQRLKGVISILFGDLLGNRASVRLGCNWCPYPPWNAMEIYNITKVNRALWLVSYPLPFARGCTPRNWASAVKVRQIQ